MSNDRSHPEEYDNSDGMLEAAEKIERSIAAMDLKALVSGEYTVGAVFHNLEILGEARALILERMRKQAPAIPLSKLTGIRDYSIRRNATIDINKP